MAETCTVFVASERPKASAVLCDDTGLVALQARSAELYNSLACGQAIILIVSQSPCRPVQSSESTSSCLLRWAVQLPEHLDHGQGRVCRSTDSWSQQSTRNTSRQVQCRQTPQSYPRTLLRAVDFDLVTVPGHRPGHHCSPVLCHHLVQSPQYSQLGDLGSALASILVLPGRSQHRRLGDLARVRSSSVLPFTGSQRRCRLRLPHAAACSLLFLVSVGPIYALLAMTTTRKHLQ